VVTPYLVKPVNANDIKLPTDGFRAATEFEQTVGNMDSRGVSGASRPGPTAAPVQAPAPKVGSADDAGLIPGDGAEDDGKPRKKAKPARRAEAAPSPGFSFK
jgi:pilus assembly protein CpaC